MALLTRVVFRASFYVCLVSLFVPLFSHTTGLMPVFSSFSSKCLVRATVTCSSSSASMLIFLAAVLIFLHHILESPCCFHFCSLLLSFCYGLARFVVFSYPVRWHFTCCTKTIAMTNRVISHCDWFCYHVSQSVTIFNM